MRNNLARSRLSTDALVAFAVFGAFWGTWGASIPRVQQQAGVDDAQFGVALLFVGAGALPTMMVVGHVIDRFGLKVTAFILPGLCVAGAAMSMTAVNLTALGVGLGIIGAVSGACDVAINSVAGRAEAATKRGVITRAHGTFSGAVVLASIGTGFSSALSLPVATPFLIVAGVSLLAGVRLARTFPERTGRPLVEPPADTDNLSPQVNRRSITPLVLIGVLGAIAFASENAHQSWSAVFVHDVLHTGNGVAAGAPAIFAGVVAITRFSISRVAIRHANRVLFGGAMAATAGAGVLATAPNLPVAVFGLAIAAVGTAGLFPTLMRIVSNGVDEASRGRATSIVTFTSYLGFLLGPVYVGLWADMTNLRGAMLAIAALGAALFVLTPPLLGLSGLSTSGRPRVDSRGTDPSGTASEGSSIHVQDGVFR